MKVTICIPCFNAARWVRQCVQSALDQQGVEPEVIVVDDGSTDGSAEIIREFGDRVTLLVGEKKGAPHARNLAWRHGTAEWVQFLDADDWLEPGKIATQLREAPDAEIIHSPCSVPRYVFEIVCGMNRIAGSSADVPRGSDASAGRNVASCATAIARSTFQNRAPYGCKRCVVMKDNSVAADFYAKALPKCRKICVDSGGLHLGVAFRQYGHAGLELEP